LSIKGKKTRKNGQAAGKKPKDAAVSSMEKLLTEFKQGSKTTSRKHTNIFGEKKKGSKKQNAKKLYGLSRLKLGKKRRQPRIAGGALSSTADRGFKRKTKKRTQPHMIIGGVPKYSSRTVAEDSMK